MFRYLMQIHGPMHLLSVYLFQSGSTMDAILFFFFVRNQFVLVLYNKYVHDIERFKVKRCHLHYFCFHLLRNRNDHSMHVFLITLFTGTYVPVPLIFEIFDNSFY